MRRLVAALSLLASCGRLGFDPLGGGGGTTDDGGRDATGDGRPLVDADIAAANRAFVTSTTYVGATLGGLTGADMQCSMRAAARGLDGTFVALLWSGGVDPATRLAGSRGWVDLAGTPIADTPEMWTTGRTYYPLQVDETGARNVDAFSWFGSSTRDCSGWTSSTAPAAPPLIPSADGVLPRSGGICTSAFSLICVETGKQVTLIPSPASGRRVFVTSERWTPGAGRSDADQFCQTKAGAGGLSGTYAAYLGITGSPPQDRFLGATPFVRPDGIPLAMDAASFRDAAPRYLTSFMTRLDGFIPQLLNDVQAWTGIASTCSDWTTTAASASAGPPSTTDKNVLFGGNTQACSGGAPLVCIEM